MLKSRYILGMFVATTIVACTAIRPVIQPNRLNVKNASAMGALGYRLFFDKRLSGDNTVSCASCHDPNLAFTDGKPTAQGIRAQIGDRNSPSVLGAKDAGFLFWDGRATTLEEQALKPITNPIEMDANLSDVVNKLKSDPVMVQQFKTVFNHDPNSEDLAKALASFERELKLQPSAYDRYSAGDNQALSPLAKKGLRIFKVEATCNTCHTGYRLSDDGFHNVGIGMDKPNPDLGRYKITQKSGDQGRFRTPSLLNISNTGPYFHDGSKKTLREVVHHYNTGGIKNPYLDKEMVTLNLTSVQEEAIVAFLESLSASSNFSELKAQYDRTGLMTRRR
jgi:cytochrome c peroxidase